MSPLYIPLLNARIMRGLSLASALLAAAGSAGAATLSAGPGKTYVSPCAAFAAAKDGDTIEIVGDWTYSGDVCAWSKEGSISTAFW